MIYRDGERIVSDVCGGFHDRVPDENLERYAADESLHDLDRAFAAATLAIRQYERLEAEELRRRVLRSEVRA